MTDLYRESILSASREPSNTGLLPEPDLTAQQRNASCGDELIVTLNLDPDHQRVTKIGWQGNGCAISQAGMSLLSEQLIGMSVADIDALKSADMLELLGLTTIAPGREKCVLLGLRAVKRALTQLTATSETE